MQGTKGRRRRGIAEEKALASEDCSKYVGYSKQSWNHHVIMLCSVLCSSEVKRTTSAAGVAQRKLVLRGTTTKKSKRRSTYYDMLLMCDCMQGLTRECYLNRQFIA